jgi:hypothetical protein
MKNKLMIEDAPELNRPVFTTGAYVFPIKRVNDAGEKYWIWTVGEFTDDCYDEDGHVFNPSESAPTLKELMVNIATDSDTHDESEQKPEWSGAQ